jgi:transcriptional regulator with GAF, ATPase, and Fis domain
MIRNEPVKIQPFSGPTGIDARYGRVADELLDLYVHQYCLNHPVCLKKLLERIEREIIFHILEETNGNQQDAAQLLGVKPNTLHYKLQRMGIVRVHRYLSDGTAESK